MLEDPLPGQRKTQLVLKIISGQQLPKPKDSMFGDRGEVKIPQILCNIEAKISLITEKLFFLHTDHRSFC